MLSKLKKQLTVLKGRRYFNQAQARKRIGKFDYQTELAYLKAITTVRGNHPKYWKVYLKYLWETQGVSEALLRKYEHALAVQNKPSSELLSRYVIMLNEAGKSDIAWKNYQYTKSLNPEIFNDYLAINAMAAEMDSNANEHMREMQSLFDYIQKSEKKFHDLIIANKDSFCVVGNSPSEIGSNNGKKIDAHKLVIRFNNFSTDGDFRKDYGSKTNIWVRSAEGSPVTDRVIPNLDAIMISGGNFAHTERKWDLIKTYAQSNIPVGFFPKNSWYNLVAKLHAPPSAGLLTLYTIYKLTGPIDPNNVYGFAFTDQLNKKQKAHYFDDAKPGIKHNWVQEKQIFESLLKPAKTGN